MPFIHLYLLLVLVTIWTYCLTSEYIHQHHSYRKMLFLLKHTNRYFIVEAIVQRANSSCSLFWHQSNDQNPIRSLSLDVPSFQLGKSWKFPFGDTSSNCTSYRSACKANNGRAMLEDRRSSRFPKSSLSRSETCFDHRHFSALHDIHKMITSIHTSASNRTFTRLVKLFCLVSVWCHFGRRRRFKLPHIDDVSKWIASSSFLSCLLWFSLPESNQSLK